MAQFKSEDVKVHIVNSLMWEKMVDWESGKITDLKKMFKPSRMHNLIPKDFLQTGGIIFAPVNIPWQSHWMLMVILVHDQNKDLIIIRAYNSLFEASYKYDPTALKVMANVVEHILQKRGVPGTPPMHAIRSRPVRLPCMRSRLPWIVGPRKYLLRKKYCGEQDSGKNECALYTVANMMIHFLKKENTHIVDDAFVVKLREFFIVLMFRFRSSQKSVVN